MALQCQNHCTEIVPDGAGAQALTDLRKQSNEATPMLNGDLFNGTYSQNNSIDASGEAEAQEPTNPPRQAS
jgi:hypothetical protein